MSVTFLREDNRDPVFRILVLVKATMLFEADFRRGEESVATCAHLKEIKSVHPNSKGCEECLKMGDSWVHLRLCLSCGHVGCCDSSKNKHATKHFHSTRHPIMRSLEAGEHWGWCYVDQVMLEGAGRQGLE